MPMRWIRSIPVSAIALAAAVAGLLGTPRSAAAQGLEYVKAHYTKYEYRIAMRDGVRRPSREDGGAGQDRADAHRAGRAVGALAPRLPHVGTSDRRAPGLAGRLAPGADCRLVGRQSAPGARRPSRPGARRSIRTT